MGAGVDHWLDTGGSNLGVCTPWSDSSGGSAVILAVEAVEIAVDTCMGGAPCTSPGVGCLSDGEDPADPAMEYLGVNGVRGSYPEAACTCTCLLTSGVFGDVLPEGCIVCPKTCAWLVACCGCVLDLKSYMLSEIAKYN